jgi:hypothetical protein
MENDIWRSLKKGSVGIHISYGDTFTNSLSATDFQLRISPRFEISFDLNKNLRTKNKQNFSYIDARHLADGEIAQLKMVQINDSRILDRIMESYKFAGKPREWYLMIHLEGERSFRVHPEKNGSALFLRVITDENVSHLITSF